MAKAKANFTQAIKAEVLPLLRANVPFDEVRDRFSLRGSSLGGYISGLKRSGQLPKEAYQKAHKGRPFPQQKATPTPESQPDKAIDDFNIGSQTTSGDGIQTHTTVIEYQVERLVPPDGLLGTHTAPFNRERCGQSYGSGRYKVTRLIPGRLPESGEFVVSGSYGPPKTPAAPRSAIVPADRGGSAAAVESLDSLFARRIARESADSSGAAAVKGLSDVVGKMVDGKNNQDPAGSLRSILEEVDRKNDARITEMQTRADNERKLERERAEDREKEREAAHTRAMALRDKDIKAQRDADERIADAQKDLEDKRVKMLMDDGDRREKRLTDQLDANSKTVTTELKEMRDRQDREFKLREDMLDLRGKLEHEKLDLVKQLGNGDGVQMLFNGLEKLGNQIHKGIREVVNLRRLELGHKPLEREDGSTENITETTDDGSEERTGNGHSKVEEQEMRTLIDQVLKTEFFQEIVKEWAHHIKVNNQPSMFANMFIEWMRDPDERNSETRKGCSAFANFMSARDWANMWPVLKEHTPKELHEVFESPNAEGYYEDVRLIVSETIQEYYEEWLLQRKKVRQAQAKEAEAKETESSRK